MDFPLLNQGFSIGDLSQNSWRSTESLLPGRAASSNFSPFSFRASSRTLTSFSTSVLGWGSGSSGLSSKISPRKIHLSTWTIFPGKKQGPRLTRLTVERSNSHICSERVMSAIFSSFLGSKQLLSMMMMMKMMMLVVVMMMKMKGPQVPTAGRYPPCLFSTHARGVNAYVLPSNWVPLQWKFLAASSGFIGGNHEAWHSEGVQGLDCHLQLKLAFSHPSSVTHDEVISGFKKRTEWHQSRSFWIHVGQKWHLW